MRLKRAAVMLMIILAICQAFPTAYARGDDSSFVVEEQSPEELPIITLPPPQEPAPEPTIEPAPDPTPEPTSPPTEPPTAPPTVPPTNPPTNPPATIPPQTPLPTQNQPVQASQPAIQADAQPGYDDIDTENTGEESDYNYDFGGGNTGAVTLTAIEMGDAEIPSGKVGKNVTITFPIIYRVGGRRFRTDKAGPVQSDDTVYYEIMDYVNHIEITPVISDPYSFPFDITRTDYTRLIIYKATGGIMTNKEYYSETFKLRSDLENGTYPVYFQVRYRENGSEEILETQIRTFIRVSGAKVVSESSGGGGGYYPTEEETALSSPKLMIKSFDTLPETVLAGGEFDLVLTLQNTSEQQRVQNIKVTLKNEAEEDYILPSSGSSSFFIPSIEPTQDYTQTIRMKVRADTPEMVHILGITLEYEDKNASALSSLEAINIPVKQEARLNVMNVSVSPDISPGMPGSLTFELVNMGRATLYNVYVHIEADQFEGTSSFQGSIEPSGNRYLDLELWGMEAGYFDGYVVIDFEDVNGVPQTSVREPLSVIITESIIPDYSYPDMYEPPELYPEVEPEQPMWMYYAIGGGAAALLLLIFIVSRARKRRKKALEEYDLD